MKEIYCSTGTMVGRINGDNYNLITPNMNTLYEEKLIDGVEFIMIKSYYDILPEILKSLSKINVKIPVFHADKIIGEMLSECDKTLIPDILKNYTINCSLAKELGAKTMVFHLWGGAKSDNNLDFNISYLNDIIGISEKYNLKLLIENIPCTKFSGLQNWRKIYSYVPSIEFVFDSRFGAFHDEIEDIFGEPIWDHIKHVHISDYSSYPRDFSKIHPILHPGEGVIDFDKFFERLNLKKYNSSITLESPSMTPYGIDITKIENSLNFIRNRYIKTNC